MVCSCCPGEDTFSSSIKPEEMALTCSSASTRKVASSFFRRSLSLGPITVLGGPGRHAPLFDLVHGHQFRQLAPEFPNVFGRNLGLSGAGHVLRTCRLDVLHR